MFTTILGDVFSPYLHAMVVMCFFAEQSVDAASLNVFRYMAFRLSDLNQKYSYYIQTARRVLVLSNCLLVLIAVQSSMHRTS